MMVAPRSRSSSTRQDRPEAKGGGDDLADFQIAAADRGAKVAQRHGQRVDNMQAGAELFAMMAARIRDAGGVIDGEEHRQRVDGFTAFGDRAGAAFGDDTAHVRVTYLTAADGPLHVEQARFRRAAGEVYRDAAQAVIGHFLGHGDSRANGAFGFVQIGDAAAAHAARAGQAAAERAQRAVAIGASDQAGNFRAADIEHTEGARAQIACARRRIGRHVQAAG